MKDHYRQTPRFDAEEEAALAALGVTLPSVPAACPDPSLLLAVDADVLDSATVEGVRAHVVACVTCQALAGDLAVILDVDPDEQERTRIRERVLASRRRGFSMWRTAAAASLATAATVAFIVVRGGSSITLPTAPAAPESALRTRMPTVFIADRPDIERAEPELTLRGTAAAPPLSEQIGRALDAADGGRVAEAAQQLQTLVAADPQSADAHLAFGAVLIRANRAADAVAILERGKALAGARATAEFDWYLAVALARSGDTARASAALAALCRQDSIRGALACAGLAELGRSAGR